jgi:hypothetical protein
MTETEAMLLREKIAAATWEYAQKVFRRFKGDDPTGGGTWDALPEERKGRWFHLASVLLMEDPERLRSIREQKDGQA